MIKNIFKGIAIHSFIFGCIFSVSVANSSLIPVLIMLVLAIPFKKMLHNMTESEILDVMGFSWAKNKFSNNEFINIFTNID